MPRTLKKARGKTGRKDPAQKTRGQKVRERRATAPERRRQAIAERYHVKAMYGDDPTRGDRRKPRPKGK
jgi:hypothetical protein